MRPCKDNSTCVHHELWCDGYEQCPDKSDEQKVKFRNNCLETQFSKHGKKNLTLHPPLKLTPRMDQ